MSRFSGPQGPGAQARAKAQRRADAERRSLEADPLDRARCAATGKVRYTEAEARAQIVDSVIKRENGNARRQERRIYPCPFCRWHHTTSKPERKEPAA